MSLLDDFKRADVNRSLGFDWFEGMWDQGSSDELRTKVRCALIFDYAVNGIGYTSDEIKVTPVSADVFEIEEREHWLNPRMKEAANGIYKPFYWFFGSQTEDRNWVLTPNGKMQESITRHTRVRSYRVQFHNLPATERVEPATESSE